jgi:hypothetical protein
MRMTSKKTLIILERAGIPLKVYQALPSGTKISISTQCRRWGKTVKDFPQYFDPLVVWIKQGQKNQLDK